MQLADAVAAVTPVVEALERLEVPYYLDRWAAELGVADLLQEARQEARV